jgi:hypothetical protein
MNALPDQSCFLSIQFSAEEKKSGDYVTGAAGPVAIFRRTTGIA